MRAATDYLKRKRIILLYHNNLKTVYYLSHCCEQNSLTQRLNYGLGFTVFVSTSHVDFTS